MAKNILKFCLILILISCELYLGPRISPEENQDFSSRRIKGAVDLARIKTLAQAGEEEKIRELLEDYSEAITSSISLSQFNVQKIKLAAAAKVIVEAVKAKNEGRELMLFLSGGSSLRALELLAQGEWRELINWKKVQIFFGDERMGIPLDHKESNANLAHELILDTLIKENLLPAKNIHRIDSTKEKETEAERYEREILEAFRGNPRVFAVLGMGEDGHLASIFSDFPWEAKEVRKRLAAAVSGRTQPNKLDRVTVTPYFLQNIVDNIMFVITGKNKARTLVQVLEDLKLSELESRFPMVKVLIPARGKTLIFADREALENYSGRE
jgi:6-phosphogluconolactonase